MEVFHSLEVPTIKTENIEKIGTDPITLESLKLETGAGAGKVMTSDSDGDGCWNKI